MIDDRLKAIVGAQGWVDDPADMQPFVTEWRDRYQGKARLVVMPANTDEVAAIVRACAAGAVSIVPQGGNTGLCGGAIPDSSGEQIVLSLRRMNRIRSITPHDYSMLVDAGCTLLQVRQAAAANDRYFPLSLAAEGSCQIGGNLSTNAGGINVLRYGTARSQVLGLEVVLPDGRIVDGLRALRKDTAGYDLKQLFIGAEGTLGIITAACLRLQPGLTDINTVLLGIDSPTVAVRLLSRLRDMAGDSLQAFELFPDRAMRFVLRHISDTTSPFSENYEWYILSSISGPQSELEPMLWQLIEEGLTEDVVIAKNSAEAAALWKLRHSISAAQKPEGVSLKHDVSVPIASVGDFIEAAESAILALQPEARIVAFGHVGDGNVHLNISQPRGIVAETFLKQREPLAELVYGIVSEFGGSFSAEHGIGQARRHHLRQYRSTEEIAVMQAIKSALDPLGIMNPGKVL